ncbi:MAG: AMP-binding protein [Bacteriovoracaceae bacterium]
MNLIERAVLAFDKNPKKVAIIDQKGRAIKYKKLKRKIEECSNVLKKIGIKKGDQVYVLVDVSIDLYILLPAIFKVGAIAVFVDPWADKHYINSCLKSVSPQFLIYTRKALLIIPLVREMRKIPNKYSINKIIRLMEKYNRATQDTFTVEPTNDHDTALITFTTGSTNIPKGFNRTHEFLLAQQNAHEKYYNHHENDIDLVIFPIFVLSNLATGLTSVLIDAPLKKINKINPLKIINQIIKYNVNSITCSPAHISSIIDHANKKNYIFPKLKKFFTGGAPVNPEIFKQLSTIFPNAEKYLVYGSTEAEPIAMIESKTVIEADPKLGTMLGRVVDGIEWQVIPVIKESIKTKPTPLKQNEIGEIILTGAFVGKHYYKNDQAFKENKIIDIDNKIWHRTSDIGYFDESGILYMVGRRNSIILEHELVQYPLKAENILDTHPLIKKSAYFQYNTTKKQSAIVLCLKKKISKDQSKKLENEVLEILKKHDIYPHKLFFTKNIAMDKRHNSKIDYYKLSKKYSKDISK